MDCVFTWMVHQWQSITEIWIVLSTERSIADRLPLIYGHNIKYRVTALVDINYWRFIMEIWIISHHLNGFLLTVQYWDVCIVLPPVLSVTDSILLKYHMDKFIYCDLNDLLLTVHYQDILPSQPRMVHSDNLLLKYGLCHHQGCV